MNIGIQQEEGEKKNYYNYYIIVTMTSSSSSGGTSSGICCYQNISVSVQKKNTYFESTWEEQTFAETIAARTPIWTTFPLGRARACVC